MRILAPVVMLLATLASSSVAPAEVLRIGGVSTEACTEAKSRGPGALRVTAVHTTGDRALDLDAVALPEGWRRRSNEGASVLSQKSACSEPLSIDVESDWVGVALSTRGQPALVELGDERRWIDPGQSIHVELGARTPRHTWRTPGTSTYRRSLADAAAYRETRHGRSTVRFEELFDLDPYPGLAATSASTGTTISFPDVFVPNDATLALSLAADDVRHASVEATSTLDDGTQSTGTAQAELKPGDLTRVSIPLGTGAGGRGAISIRLSADPGSPATLRLVDPELRGTEPVGPPRTKRPSVILITLDTVRADHLSLYGYEHATTPFLDEMEDELVVFENAYSQVPSTRPSHFSILASRYPRDLGIWTNSDPPLAQSELTLAEVLRSAGWRTGAISSVRFLVSDGGAGQGFDVVSRPPRTKQSQLGKHTTERAIDFMRSSQAQPFFLWVHYFDAHLPYQPVPELRDAFWDGPPPTEQDIEPDLIEKEGFGTLHAIPNRAYMTAMYDASILYLDRQIRALLDHLKEAGILDDTILAIASDHGESLGEHGVFFAHDGLHEPNVRVPLVLRLPDGAHAGRVEEVVENLGIAPTILDAVGLEIPESFRGSSLLRDTPGNGAAFFEQGALFSGVRAGGLKWIDGRGFAADDRFVDSNLRKLREEPPLALYDLDADPAETTNLASEREQDAKALGRRLSTWGEAHDDAKRRAGERKVEPEMLERLRALGYTE